MQKVAITMLKFKFDKREIKVNFFSGVLLLLFLFFTFELLLPLNSKLFLFRTTYGVEYTLKDSTPPSNIVFEKEEYEVGSNQTIFIPFDFEGSNDCCKQSICWSSDETIALVYSTNFNELIVTGVSPGAVNVNIACAIDSSLKKSITIIVHTFEPLSYNGLEMPSPCYTLENNLVYQTNPIIEYGQNLKINYVVKNDKFVIIPSRINFEIEDSYSNCIDSNGNFISRPECIGKAISIKVWSPSLLENYSLQPIEYSIRVNYPKDYGNLYLSTYLNIFLTYCLSFGVIGLLAGAFFNYIITDNQTKLSIFLLAFTVIFSLIILILHTFLLSRTFDFKYWIVSPLMSAICFLVTIKPLRTKLLTLIREILK